VGIYSSREENRLRNAGKKETSSASFWPRKSFWGSAAITAEEGWALARETCSGRRIRPHNDQLDGTWSHQPNLENYDSALQADSPDAHRACDSGRIVALLLVRWQLHSAGPSVVPFSVIVHIKHNLASEILHLRICGKPPLPRTF
jgi:hypothetical protein